jgi:hypothetical protein
MNKSMITLSAKVLSGLLIGVLAVLAVYAHVPAVAPAFGSLTGPDIPSPYLRWGGLGPIWNYSQSPTATSSVFCASQAPVGTSTLVFASWRPDNAAFGSSQTFDLSTTTAAGGYGSSTPALIIAANLQNAQVWLPEASTTPANPLLVLSAFSTTGGSNAFVIVNTSTSSPTWLTWRVATSTPGTFPIGLTGNCQAQFIQI